MFMKNNMAQDWSTNIIEGSKALRTPTQWKHYYVWLANPNNYNEEEANLLEIDQNPPLIEPYPECMKVETFQNGNETIVSVTNPTLYPTQADDEKVES